MTMQQDIELSIILPVHNEEHAISPLLRGLSTVIRDSINKKSEIIIVDDASTDGSVKVIEEVGSRDFSRENEKNTASPFLRLIRFPSSCGQARALRAGFTISRGALILTMDGDGQYDPADIPRLLELTDSFDMVCGIRNQRTDGPSRMFCSRTANAFRNLITGDCIQDAGCTFRIMRRECLGCLSVFAEKPIAYDFFFHPLFVRSGGYRVGEIFVTHRNRIGGRSKYHLIRGRLLSGILVCMQVKKLLTTTKTSVA